MDKEEDKAVEAENEKSVEKEQPKKKKPEPKKAKKGEDADEVLVKNTIELKPKLEEAPGKTAVLGWGRMNPITVGHEKLVNKIKSVARSEGGDPILFLTHSQDAKKNPLTYDDKYMLATRAFGKMVRKSRSKTIIQAAQELQKKYKNIVLVVGSDRVKTFDDLLNKYNGKDYSFDSIKVVSAGDRDPDADDVTGMSASKMRALAKDGDMESFSKGLPKKLKANAKDVYDMVRGGMKISEELELDEAILSFAQRRQRAMTMRKYKSKIAAARKRMSKRVATKDRLQKKARKKAIAIIRGKVAGDKGKRYSELSTAEKMMIDQKVAKRKAVIDRIAKKLLPKVRRADIARVQGKKVSEEYNLDEHFDLFIEEPTVGQDPDIKDKKGTQPAVYYKGLSKSTKDKRDAHFKKGTKMDDDNPAAYKPAPGDATAKTKPSKHTKKFKDMYGEELIPLSKFHSAQKKDGSVKTDGRFKIFRKKNAEAGDTSDKAEIKNKIIDENKAEERLRTQHKAERENMKREHDKELDSVKTRGLRRQIRDLQKEEFDTDEALLAFIEEVSNDISDSVELSEAKGDAGLKAKAEKSGMPLGILRQVYNRGVAAWRTGHRPGTTPQQWGFARVNSFVTKSSGTWGKADADLAAKVRGSSKKEEVESPIDKKKDGSLSYKKTKVITEDDPCWDTHEKRGMKKKGGKLVPNCVPKNEAVSPAQQAAIAIAKKKKEKLDEALQHVHTIKIDGNAPSNPKPSEVANIKSDFKLHVQAIRGATKRLGGLITDTEVPSRQNKFVGTIKVGTRGDANKISIPVIQRSVKSGGIELDKRQFVEETELDEEFEYMLEGYMASKLKSVTINKKAYQHALKTLKDVITRKKKESGGIGMKHGSNYYAQQVAKTYRDVDHKVLHNMLGEEYIFEEGGAGDRGTDKLTKRYKKDTPGESVSESEGPVPKPMSKMTDKQKEDLRHKQAAERERNIRKMKIGQKQTDDDRKRREADRERRLRQYAGKREELELDDMFESVISEREGFKQFNEDVSQKQISDLEKFADRLLDKFGVDVEFTRHFADRMNDDRNNPKISIPELQRFFKKVAKNKAKDIKQLGDSEAVLKDIQADLNLPVVINYDKAKNEFEVVNKTIMRKKDFKTPNKIVKY